jgi:thiopurine S-methyltransferase
MDAQFWQGKWRKGEIAFHSESVNSVLEAHWPDLGVPSAARVFVPLCGKTQDMRWLSARGQQVVGVELSEIACTEYFGDYDIPFGRQAQGGFTCFDSEGVRLLCGDFFSLTAHDLGAAIGFWDRAALIALPPAMRRDYAAKMSQLLPVGAVGLLVSLSYPQDEKKGPPFSVSTEEVHELYGRAFEIAQLADEDIIDLEPRFRGRWGLSALSRQVYRLRRRS